MNTLQLEYIIKEKGGVSKLAEKLGVNRQTIYYYINQGDKNSLETLKKIAIALEVELEDLYVKDDQENLHGVLEFNGISRVVNNSKDLFDFIKELNLIDEDWELDNEEEDKL